ncbi:hypothetical protein [Hirschia litorea]|uniref:Uncharacterized protein n=1 Tax=Hirschia litorea TaxID=1199156 RepID=A0ABW2IPM9_9PROT
MSLTTFKASSSFPCRAIPHAKSRCAALLNEEVALKGTSGISSSNAFAISNSPAKPADGEEKEIAYTWTIPQAPRIGINLKWMLANCFQVSNEDVTPYFKHEPLLNLNDGVAK